jgi:hypothetical protein
MSASLVAARIVFDHAKIAVDARPRLRVRSVLRILLRKLLNDGSRFIQRRNAAIELAHAA